MALNSLGDAANMLYPDFQFWVRFADLQAILLNPASSVVGNLESPIRRSKMKALNLRRADDRTQRIGTLTRTQRNISKVAWNRDIHSLPLRQPHSRQNVRRRRYQAIYLLTMSQAYPKG